jgi:hypothetical protein
MRSAKAGLRLDQLWVIHPGAHEFPMDEGITALPVGRLGEAAARWA